MIETISVAKKIEDLRVRFGFEHCFSVDKVGRGGGLAVLWKGPLQCQISSYSHHHIDVVFIEGNVESWRLSCFYGYPERTRRRDSWALIRKLESLSTIPWCIWGDFNDLMHASDKKGGLNHSQYLLDGFSKTIHECQLSELHLSGGTFTWERSRGTEAWVREKLDRGFATDSWWRKFPLHELRVAHTSVSDHEPLVLEFLRVNMEKKVFRFRFENMWLKEPEFTKEVTDTWSALPPIHLLPKLLELSSFMACWGRTFFHKFREKIKYHKANLDRLVDCTDQVSMQEYIAEKERLNTLLLNEETNWKQRTNIFWLREGDDNTKFFHSSAMARKEANKVTYLMDNDGTKVEDQDEMCRIVRDYFTSLFTVKDRTDMATMVGHRQVTTEQNIMLSKEFTFDEFTLAIKQMHPDKAAGPDGLNPGFFHHFWPLLGHEVFRVCISWL